VLVSLIHPEHKLCLLAKKIDWAYLEKEFAPLYAGILRFPLIKGGLADPIVPANVRNRFALILFTQDLDDLALCKLCLFHTPKINVI